MSYFLTPPLSPVTYHEQGQYKIWFSRPSSMCLRTAPLPLKPRGKPIWIPDHVKTPKYDPPLCNTIRHADLYIPKVLFDPKTFVYLWNLFIWNFVPSRISERYFGSWNFWCTSGTYLYGISYPPECSKQSRPAFEGLGTQDREWCPVYGPHHSGSHVGDLGQGPPVEWGF